MVSSRFLVVSLALLGLASMTFGSQIKPRISGGAEIDTLSRFPHHVTIDPIAYNDKDRYSCAGSILSKNWILTSASCVVNTNALNLHFERLYRNSTAGSFTLAINSNSFNVIPYPTGWDDLAMLKIPVDLIFSKTIRPIALSRVPAGQWLNQLAVIAGFNETSPSSSSQRDILNYAMLKVVPTSVCQNAYKPGPVDDYLNICAQGYGNSRNTPTLNDYGSGLLVGWPRDSQLVGTLCATSYDSTGNNLSVYTNIQKYVSWIDSIMANN